MLKQCVALFRRFNRLFWLAIICCALSGMVLCCIPFINLNGSSTQKTNLYIFGGLFWIGIILEQLFFWRTNSLRKKAEGENGENTYSLSSKSRIGIFSFFQNIEAIICDIVLILSAVLVVLSVVLQIKEQWLIIVSIVLLFLSLNLHCFFNGKNYLYKKEYNKYIDSEEYKENE